MKTNFIRRLSYNINSASNCIKTAYETDKNSFIDKAILFGFPFACFIAYLPHSIEVAHYNWTHPCKIKDGCISARGVKFFVPKQDRMAP